MADVAGFRALGFVADKVALDKAVAPAEIESTAERDRCAALDPHNAIRLLDPALSSPALGAKAGAAAGGELVAEWLAAGVLRQDSGRALYRYHQDYTLPELSGRVLSRRSFLCAVRLPSLSDGGIKTHLAVRPDEVAAQADLMVRHRVHAAPAMAAYRDPSHEVDRLFRKVESAPPTFQVQTPDGTWHRIWRCSDAEVIGKVRHLFLPRKLYALDGQERLAAMQVAGQRLAEAEVMPMYAAGNYAMMCLVNLEDQALLPSPCHRLVGGPALTSAEVLARATRYFSVVKLEGLAASAQRLAATVDGWTATQASFALAFPGTSDVWQLTLLPAVNPRDEGVVGHPAVTRLDPVVIEELFLRRVLGQPALAPVAPVAPVALVAPVAPPAAAAPPESAAAPTSPPVAAVAGSVSVPGEWPVGLVHDAGAALAALAAKTAWMAILSRPVPMQQVVHVADLGQELPPRSTHFHPQVLGGLAMLRLTADEDLM